MMQAMRQPKSVWGWALYDWGNSAYSTAVMAGFFPIFFKQYWSEGTDVNESTFYLGIANFSASLVIVLLAPLLGAMADRCGHRKRYLFRFALLGIVTTALLPLVGQGEWQWAVFFFVLATVGFSGSISFYDSLLIFVAPRKHYDHISALGYAIGYLGGGLLFAVTVGMTLKPELFGLTNAAEAVKMAFYLVAGWWGLFTLPLMMWVVEPDGRNTEPSVWRVLVDALKELKSTFAEVRQQRMVWLFLIAYWCYIDGVDTVIRMAVDYGLALGFDSDSLIVALLITQFVGFPAALVFGKIGTIRGPKFGIQIAIAIYTLIIIYAYFMDSEFEFYMMAIAIGLVQGGIQSLSRSLYTRLIPQEKSAEFFGFYNVLGKFAALVGPLLIGWTSLITHDSRLSILSLIPLFAIGAWLLTKVEVE